jgi:hypothetical protein
VVGLSLHAAAECTLYRRIAEYSIVEFSGSAFNFGMGYALLYACTLLVLIATFEHEYQREQIPRQFAPLLLLVS